MADRTYRTLPLGGTSRPRGDLPPAFDQALDLIQAGKLERALFALYASELEDFAPAIVAQVALLAESKKMSRSTRKEWVQDTAFRALAIDYQADPLVWHDLAEACSGPRDKVTQSLTCLAVARGLCLSEDEVALRQKAIGCMPGKTAVPEHRAVGYVLESAAQVLGVDESRGTKAASLQARALAKLAESPLSLSVLFR